MVAKVQENGKDRQARLAEVLDALPEATRLRIIESVREHLISEGRAEQYALLLDDATDADVCSQPAPEKVVQTVYERKAHRRHKIAFGWYGGKFSHLQWLLPLLPHTNHYCEPFGGSAAVLLNREPSPVETYNDVDGEVVNFFRVLREQTDALLEAIGLTPFSRQEFCVAVGPVDQTVG